MFGIYHRMRFRCALCLAQDTRDYSHLEELSTIGVPLVLFGRTCLPELFSSVTANGDEAAYTTIQQMGLRMPDDVAIIGFTDDVHAAFVTPRLSAIADQSTLMGQTACRLLLRAIGGDTKIYHEIVPQKLIIRDTSAKKK